MKLYAKINFGSLENLYVGSHPKSLHTFKVQVLDYIYFGVYVIPTGKYCNAHLNTDLLTAGGKASSENDKN